MYGSVTVPVPDVTPFAGVKPLLPTINMYERFCSALALRSIGLTANIEASNTGPRV